MYASIVRWTYVCTFSLRRRVVLADAEEADELVDVAAAMTRMPTATAPTVAMEA